MAQLTPKSISQAKLRRYLELKGAEEELKQLKAEIVHLALEVGLTAQPGPISFQISFRKGQIRPQWLQEGKLLAIKLEIDPEEWEKDVKSRTPRGEDQTVLEVFDRDNPVKGKQD